MKRNREVDRGKLSRHRAASAAEPEDDFALSATQRRELERRVKDLDDRTRYILVSSFSRRFELYYDVSEDTYAMNAPTSATLFKRRAAALAVKSLLGPPIRVVRCRVDRRGRLVLASLPSPTRPSARSGR